MRLYILFFILVSCGVPKEDYNKLVSKKDSLATEVEVLKAGLDECTYGEERTIALIEKSYKENDFVTAEHNINQLSVRHPQSSKNEEFKDLLKVIKGKKEKERKRIEAEEKEKERLANLNNTGIWRVGHYVDDFGEPTKDGYITNNAYIKGKFSNTATEGSDLNVTFLISNSSKVYIQLYEYARNNPVKGYSDSYTVLIKDNDDNKIKLFATNNSDRLTFNKTNSVKVHNALMKGGFIQFRIDERGSATEYSFDIGNANWYENAYRLLKEQ